MKNLLKISTIACLALAFTFLSSCSEDLLDISDTNGPSEEAVLGAPADFISYFRGSTATGYLGITTLWGSHYQLMADQMTSTNKYIEFWDFAEEPRKRLNNTVAYGGSGAITTPWANFNEANFAANQALESLTRWASEGKPVEEGGVDRAKDLEIGAYFLKGFTRGFLGVIYNQAYEANSTIPEDNPPVKSYSEMIEIGIGDLEKAIMLANAHPSMLFDFLPNASLDQAQFIEVCNSYMAKILASKPRSEGEAVSLGAAHWNRVLAYANAGVSADWAVESSSQWYNQLIDWGTYTLGSGAGYLPTDIKVAHMAHTPGSIPQYYPPAPAVLDSGATIDSRFYQYFDYVTDYGYLNGSRNRGLFTNWRHIRYWNANDQSQAGVMNMLFSSAENQLLKAEATWRTSGAAAAAAIIDAIPQRAGSGIPAMTSPSDADIKNALHHEYAIELDFAAGLTDPWSFMRRNDLLIQGTPTQMPRPASRLEVTVEDIYSYGGKAFEGETGFYGEIGTAPASGGWKPSE